MSKQPYKSMHKNIAKCIAMDYIYFIEQRFDFEWDDKKDAINREKHEVSFAEAQEAFLDQNRVIAKDLENSQTEQRYYCLGKVNGSVMTVRFTYRYSKIRIIGAGYWRKGRKIYETYKKELQKEYEK